MTAHRLSLSLCCVIPLGLGNKGLARQARLRRLSETSNGGSEADGGQDIKYGYVLSELFSSPRHTRVPLEVRTEQLLVISAHCCDYEKCLHGGVYPVGPCGGIVDAETGRPYLEQQLVPGVELLRCVCYQMARVDDFNFAVQAEYEARADGSVEPNERQRVLLRDVYKALSAPLDERFRMLHPWPLAQAVRRALAAVWRSWALGGARYLML